MVKNASRSQNQLSCPEGAKGINPGEIVETNRTCGAARNNGSQLTWARCLLLRLACMSALCILANPHDLRSQCVQTDYSPDLQDRLQSLLSQFMACSPDDPQAACNVFAAKALNAAYGIEDFIQTDPASGKKTYLTADVIALNVKTDTRWIDLGPANTQASLDAAQQAANCGRAVIATEFNPTGSGHVALILPGLQATSDNWGLSVPNSASFFVNKPKSAYVGKGLSYAFQLPDGIEIYARATP